MSERTSRTKTASPDNLPWKKSSYSAANGNCVEVAPIAPGKIGVRDSRNVPGGNLVFSLGAWKGAIASINRNELPGIGQPPTGQVRR